MRLLLTTLNAKYIHLNLAIRLLYQLHKDREGIAWKEFTIKQPIQEIADYCKDYEVVAFSCYIWNITPTLQVAKLLKELNPSIKILLGGPEVSYDWQSTIELPYVDFIITGEGEIPFQRFMDLYPNVAMVPNLVSKINGEVHFHQQSVQFDLNEYASINPYIDDPTADLLQKVLYIETSRGCPYKCEFCLASLDNKVRYLPIHAIKSNLLYLMTYGKVIKFLDRTFNVKKDFTIDIFQFILDNHMPVNVFQFEITADIVHPDIVSFIQAHVPKGLFRFEIGIQTVNQKANLEVSRKQNFEKTSAVIKQLDNKVEMHLDLIVGLPLDYWADIRHSIDEVFKLYPPELQLGFLKFLKGTPVREKFENYGFKFDPMPPYQIIESNFLTQNELEQIVELENALEIYWNKKRALYTLRYVSTTYSAFEFLLGLGHYFGTRQDFHRYTLKNIYDIIFDFAALYYKEDVVLKELIILDYYLQYKVRPQQLYIPELNKDVKQDWIAKHNLNVHKYRHVLLPLHFNLNHLNITNEIAEGEYDCVIEYDGVNKPTIKTKSAN
jgi:anaerobic magnesium-protoporphyrin IX monomethyl ester cyclase